ncbi:MAG: hypothetical protein K2M12_08530 [Muribaculaceae bacterium]|nr:hypothetical protein [Muribaculaceae bacterium]
MNESSISQKSKSEWFAIKTKQDFRAETEFTPLLDDVLFPKEIVRIPGKKNRQRAIIPHVLFIKTTCSKALELEKQGREHPEQSIQFWIYRYPKENKIQPISESSIHLLRLLATDDTTKCEIFTKTDFKENQYVRIVGGDFEGYTGYVVRVKKNKHVVVKIDGICLILLPYIHPDLLEPTNSPNKH